MRKKFPSDIDLSKGFTELEAMAAWFERGETDLDTGVKKFEHAMELAAALKRRLLVAENRVKSMKKKYASSSSSMGE